MRLFTCALNAAAVALTFLPAPASSAAPKKAAADQPLKRQQATIKGLVIRELGNGKHAGAAIGVVATAQGEADDGKITISGKIGDDMKSALH